MLKMKLKAFEITQLTLLGVLITLGFIGADGTATETR